MSPNRLAGERSPYLRQHASNPVDWWPWGPEAFAQAAARDRPVFLSVGYAACHWCHVMERESFEDEATARILDETFVCVKVDREERPDVDRVYMDYVQLRTGRGGWPMTVFLTPEGRPFWGATYVGRRELQALAEAVGRAWGAQRAEIEAEARAAAAQLARLAEDLPRPAAEAGGGGGDEEVLPTLRRAAAARFDPRHGGYGHAPKFPPHALLLTLLDGDGARMGAEDRAQVLATLDGMERGGLHDQVGGGFHRYSTDARWFLPHFEKMLYDNALLAQAYARAFALTGEPRWRRVVERLLGWVERDLRRPQGGYASSLDADTEGHEGRTYTWTLEEVRAVLGPQDAERLARAYGLEAGGNVHDEATGEPSGRSLPWRPEPGAETLDALLEALRVARDRRPQPALDEKVITAWNGLLLSAFACAGRDLREPAWFARGRVLASFLLESCRRGDGTLLRFPRDSGPEIPGFCEDHAHLAEGLLDLGVATGEARWGEAARDLLARMDAAFGDPERGGWFASAPGLHETLLARARRVWDDPIPSDNGAAARAALRAGSPALREAAERALAAFRPLLAESRALMGVVALVRALQERLERGGGPVAPLGDAQCRRGAARVDAFLERTQARPGTRVGLLVRVCLDEGWHVNANPASRPELVATRLRAGPGCPARLQTPRYPPAVRRPVGGVPTALYEGTFEIRAALEVPADAPPGPRRLSLVLDLQACDAEACAAPEEVALDLPLRFDPEDGPRRHGALFG